MRCDADKLSQYEVAVILGYKRAVERAICLAQVRANRQSSLDLIIPVGKKR
jgi:hypothetical protein